MAVYVCAVTVHMKFIYALIVYGFDTNLHVTEDLMP
jgi:hypothetical protein